MQRFLYLCLLCFTITLAAIIGWRLSDRAMYVIVGVVAGATASIPTSLIVVWATLRTRAAPLSAGAPPDPPPQPQVIIVHAAPAPVSRDNEVFARQRSLTALPAYAEPEPTAIVGLPTGARHFTILGDDIFEAGI
jgi:hypothetical protein